MQHWLARMPFPYRCALCGLWIVATLPLSMLLAAALSVTFGMTPDFGSWPLPVTFTLVHVVVGAIWAVTLARLAGYVARRRAGIGGALGVTIPFWVALLALNALEEELVWFHVRSIPVHQVFIGAFSLAALGVAAIAAGALGGVLGGAGLGVRVALGGGLAAGLAFLIVAVLMDALGMRVGAPGAEARATMLTVMFVGMIGAALTGNLVVGLLLRRAQEPTRMIGETAA